MRKTKAQRASATCLSSTTRKWGEMRLELGSFPLSSSHPTALLTSFGGEGGGKWWRSLHLLLGLRA